MPAALAGGAFALAGATWRATRSALAAVLLVHEWPGRAAQTILAAELTAGLALPLLITRRGAALTAFALTAVAALVLGAAEAEVRETLRHAGWRGR